MSISLKNDHCPPPLPLFSPRPIRQPPVKSVPRPPSRGKRKIVSKYTECTVHERARRPSCGLCASSCAPAHRRYTCVQYVQRRPSAVSHSLSLSHRTQCLCRDGARPRVQFWRLGSNVLRLMLAVTPPRPARFSPPEAGQGCCSVKSRVAGHARRCEEAVREQKHRLT